MTTPTSTDYPAGSAKRNIKTGAIAVRTDFADDDDYGHKAWLSASTNLGARDLLTIQVSTPDWVDLYVPSATPVTPPVVPESPTT